MRLNRRQSRRVVERGDRSGKLTIEKGLVSSTPINPYRKPVVIPGNPPEGQPEEHPAMSAPATKPRRAGRRPPKVLRREDYADIYQVGRRVSSTQKVYGRPSSEARGDGARTSARSLRSMGLPFGRLPQQQPSARAGAAPAAVMGKRSRFNPRALIVSLTGAAVVTAAVLGVISVLEPEPVLALGQEVLFDGRTLCIVDDRKDVENAMRKIEEDLRNEFGMDVQQSGELAFRPVFCDSQNILDGREIEQVLRSNIDAKVVAAVITVNGHPAVALRTEEEARRALEAVLEPYRNVPASRYRSDVGFVEDVQVKQMPIDFSLVQSYEDALRTLSLGAGVQDNIYTVKKGDTLAKIAKKYGLKVSELRKANPSLASDVIQPGQKLNAVKPLSWVSVCYTEQVERQEILPYQVIEEKDDSLYTTQTKVKQEGVNGKRNVWAKITYINGMEAKEEVLSETVITDKQDKIVLRGTKPVPTSSGGGSISSGKYIKPLKSYTISSVFGKRTLNGETSTHYGIDMAAPTGTPIYASRGGTVTKSGSASGYGLVIYIDHGDGVQTRYGHCSKLLVKSGQKVSQGQIIALVGSTGRSTGPHLHFEMRINGTAVDPRKYVKLAADTDGKLYYMEDKKRYIWPA